MSPASLVTSGERFQLALWGIQNLFADHDLPAPAELSVRDHGGVRADARFDRLADLKRWAEVTDAAVTASRDYDGLLHVACTVVGYTPLRLTCLDKALTP